jgi:beta-glucosidase
VAPEKGEVIRPVRELKAFEQVELKPGESREVSLRLDKRAFAHWSAAAHDWCVEPGKYTIQIGASAHDILLEAAVQHE